MACTDPAIRHIDNAKDLILIRLLFIHVLEQLKHRPTLPNVMKWLTLPAILFCTRKGRRIEPASQGQANFGRRLDTA